jgi:PAS domain S-box-containing protein
MLVVGAAGAMWGIAPALSPLLVWPDGLSAGNGDRSSGVAVVSGSSDAQVAFVILALATCAVSWLTLHFEARRNVSLLVVPVTLAWWQLGAPAAMAIGAFGALFGNATRRASITGSVAGAARIALAIGAGSIATRLIAVSPIPAGGAGPNAAQAVLSLAHLAHATLFVLAFSLADLVLDWADRRLHPGGWDATALLVRTDLTFNLLLLPLMVLFEAIYLALGYERQGVMLGGVLALLLVVRTYTNLRTMHDALQGLHRTVSEEREKLDTLVTHSGEAIFTVDPKLTISTANPAMQQLLGVPADQILGRACADVCHFEDEHGVRLCPDRCPLVAAKTGGAPVSVDVIYQAPDQPPKGLLLTYAAVTAPNGDLRLGIGIARDMSAQREAERLREEFVSLVTHELRSPLTSSTGYLDLLRRLIERAPISSGFDLDRALGYVNRIQGAERHLLRLVNNLLEIARVEQTDLPLDLAEVRLGNVISEVLDGIAPQAQEKRITIRREGEPDLPPIWTADLYLHEVLGNLVSNAVKYTPEEGTVIVRLREEPGDTPEPKRLAVIDVVDTGYGMSPEDLGRLFSRFFRSGRPEIRKERGTGLGLALSRRMVERIGGRIDVQSELGRGSTFTLRLPMTPVPVETPAESVPTSV